MKDLLHQIWQALRAYPVFAALMLLSVGGFGVAGWQGYRLLGDDNESAEGRDGAPRSGGHGSSSGARYYHK